MSKMIAFLVVVVVGGFMIAQPAHAGSRMKHPHAQAGKVQKNMKRIQGFPGDFIRPRTTARKQSGSLS
ncbi:MAG: hypothetical protein U1E76_19750 [Planctomycetota bacterium]